MTGRSLRSAPVSFILRPVYATCLFCHAPLGTNGVIEPFPIGRRLAFECDSGRLWAVCRACERWNLSPIEERWEAVETCDRAFRTATLRFSTQHIGLARLDDGTELVRIGHAVRPELAAWRYGDQFGRRRRRWAIAGATTAAGVATVYGAGLAVGAMGLVAVNLTVSLVSRAMHQRIRLRTYLGDRLVALSSATLAHVELRPSADGAYELRIPIIQREGALRAVTYCTVRGHEAMTLAATVLPHMNTRGASDRTRRRALALLARFPDAQAALTQLATARRSRWGWLEGGSAAGMILSDPAFRLGRLDAAERLCLEMLVHEDDERHALEGELADLERRWKEADEIARISDALLLDDASPSGSPRTAAHRPGRKRTE